uniref:Uncharacterized protein n=1 Tax=Arundo donax TaxID=35708 RepID=A0A0A9F976_ARUDO
MYRSLRAERSELHLNPQICTQRYKLSLTEHQYTTQFTLSPTGTD